MHRYVCRGVTLLQERRSGLLSAIKWEKPDDLLKGEIRVFLLILKSIYPKEVGVFLSIPEFLSKLR